MRFLHEYIERFKQGSKRRKELAARLQETKRTYDIFSGGRPKHAFEKFVEQYNWLGNVENKTRFKIDQNLARNLPGALMQDYMLHLVIQLCEPHPQLEVFTEAKVPFGRYPLWMSGEIAFRTPSEHSDLAVGYLVEGGRLRTPEAPWPRQPFYGLERNQSVQPLITINTKIRISQSEFFDWQGREQLMVKGNPHCLSVQVALRKEMDYDIVEAAQARGKFFLLGEGGETTVTPNRKELTRFIDTFTAHLKTRMEG
jgi:hypothetical protein